MTKRSLNPGQRRTLEIIEELGFGRIEQLSIHNGEPRFDWSPRILQEIRLGSEPELRQDRSNTDLTLKTEIESLFNHLSKVRDGIVDIEIRHGIPFRLVLKRSDTEFALARTDKPS